VEKTQMKQKSQGNEQPTSLNICFDDLYSLSPNMDLSNEMKKGKKKKYCFNLEGITR
jgi:hypothetical protein